MSGNQRIADFDLRFGSCAASQAAQICLLCLSAMTAARGRRAVIFIALSAHYALVPVLVHWAHVAPRAVAAPSSGAVVLGIQAVRLAIAGALALLEIRGVRDPGPSALLHPRLTRLADRRRAAWPQLRDAVFSGGLASMILPATLFAVQNALHLVSAGALPPSVYICLSQLRMVITACCSAVILGRSIVLRRWGALLVITLGAVAVEVSDLDVHAHAAVGSSSGGSASTALAALLTQCLLNGISVTVFERALKAPSHDGLRPSLWVRNVQLALVGIPISFLLARPDRGLLGVFAGFTGRDVVVRTLVWGPFLTRQLVGHQALGGLLVALCLKHADGIGARPCHGLG